MTLHQPGSDKIVVVGIGDDGFSGLSETAKKVVSQADVVLGPESTLKLLDPGFLSGTKVPLSAEMPAALEQVSRVLGSGRAVIVNYGDPLFYGVARYLMDRIGKDRFEILPHVSSMQLAFARIKESWDDAYLASLEGRSIDSVVDRIRTAEKVGLFSSERVSPSQLAKRLLDQKIDYFRAYVCENLGQPDERVTQAELSDLTELEFNPLHVLILIRKPDRPDRASAPSRRRLFGNPDDAFAQTRPRRGLITQAEVRALALAQLDIRPNSTVWDIGAGSGSVSIEAAQLAPLGVVYAIESEPNDLGLIETNAEEFGVKNVKPVAGRAPECLTGLPAPDAIFIGGTGKHVGAVLRAAYEQLQANGNLVMNVATIDGLAAAHQTLKELAGEVRLWQVGIARGIDQMDRVRFQASNPTFLLGVTKPGPARS